MKDAVRFVILTRHGDIRSGWKILLFLIGTAGIVTGVMSVAERFARGNDLLASSLFLISILGVTWAMVRFINRKPLGAVGLWFHPRAIRELGMGLLIGVLMMSGIFIVMYASGYVQVTWLDRSGGQVLWTIAYALFFFAVAAASEELLFRGYVYQTLSQGITVLPSILLMSAFFGLGHVKNPNATVLSTINVALAGIWLAFAYQKTRSLWLPVGLHLAWNFSQTTVFGFPTSGMEFSTLRLWNTTVTGPDMVTGGPFGPEGGILTTLALIIGTWYILKSAYLAAPEGIITLDSVEDVLPPATPPAEGSGNGSAG